jgi:DNA primase
MDADSAGRSGPTRWVDHRAVQSGRPVLVADLPPGRDPADWLTQRGPAGLALLDPTRAGSPGGPRQPGPEIVHAVLSRKPRDPARTVTAALQPLLAVLPTHQADDLAAGAIAEMSRQGWNPDQVFTRMLVDSRRGTERAPANALRPAL